MIFSAVRRRLQRRIPAIVRYLRIGMRYAPPRLVFFCIVLAMKAGLPGSRLLPRAFAALVLLRLSEDPKYRFARSSSHALAATTIEVLYRSGAYEEAVEYVDRDLALSMRPRKFLRSLFDMSEGAGDYGDGNSFFLARSRKLIFKAGSLFELGRFAEALEATRSAVQLLSSRNEPNWLRLRGHLELLCGDSLTDANPQAASQMMAGGLIRRAVDDIRPIFVRNRTWRDLATVDMRSKYRRTFLGPWWITASHGLFALTIGAVSGKFAARRVLNRGLQEVFRCFRSQQCACDSSTWPNIPSAKRSYASLSMLPAVS